MKKTKFLRPLIYIGVAIIMIAAIQLKKMDILEDKNQVAVSLLVEIDKYGLPVDVEKIGAVDLKETLRFTVQPEDRNKGIASFYMSRNQRGKIKVGKSVLGTSDQKILGQVVYVSSSPNLSNGLYVGRIQLNAKARSAIASFTSVDIVIATLKNRLSVSVESVEYEGDQAYVWKSVDEKAERVPVKLGGLAGGRYDVLSGLKRGDLVVVNGQSFLEAGAKLRLRECYGCSDEEKGVES